MIKKRSTYVRAFFYLTYFSKNVTIKEKGKTEDKNGTEFT